MLAPVAGVLAWLASMVAGLSPPLPVSPPAVSPVPTQPSAPVAATPSPSAASQAERGVRKVGTAYCETGRMANGEHAHVGAVASRDYELGTVLGVSTGPYGEGEVIVADRPAKYGVLDFSMPGDCAGALRWGRREVVVTQK